MTTPLDETPDECESWRWRWVFPNGWVPAPDPVVFGPPRYWDNELERTARFDSPPSDGFPDEVVLLVLAREREESRQRLREARAERQVYHEVAGTASSITWVADHLTPRQLYTIHAGEQRARWVAR